MKKSNFIKSLLFCILVWPIFSNAQEKVLSIDQLKEIIDRHHPMVVQSNLILENAKQNVRIARAPFDPALAISNKQKTFDGQSYYNYRTTSLEIPTWLGVDLSAGYQNNVGEYINNELTLGNSYYVGGSVSITNGLFMNQRRATLLKAQRWQNASVQERTQWLNELYYNAYSSYYDWLKEYLVYSIYTDLVELNTSRLDLAKNTWRLGNAPAIDTIEAQAQLQQVELLKMNSSVQLKEKGIKLSQHIWDSTRYEELVQGSLIPDSASVQRYDFTESDMITFKDRILEHPILMINDAKQDMLRIEQKLNKQALLPDVSLSAFVLGKQIDNFGGGNLADNNRYGISVGMPLRLSKGRGQFQLNKNELFSTRLKRDLDERKLENLFSIQVIEIRNAKNQIGLYRTYTNNIRKMYDAERLKYTLGSSTLFLINARENKYLEAKLKEIDNAIKYQLAIIELYKVIAALPTL